MVDVLFVTLWVGCTSVVAFKYRHCICARAGYEAFTLIEPVDKSIITFDYVMVVAVIGSVQ